MKDISFDLKICNYRSSLVEQALKFTKNIDDADDLVQDTLVKAIRYERLYKEGTNLGGWLFTIMRNTFINNYKRVCKKLAVVQTSEDLSSYQLTTSASYNNGQNKFIQEDIQRAMQKLQPALSIPFLKYFEGFKYQEIADELDLPIGTIKTRIHEARKVLKANLKMYHEEFARVATA